MKKSEKGQWNSEEWINITIPVEVICKRCIVTCTGDQKTGKIHLNGKKNSHIDYIFVNDTLLFVPSVFMYKNI